MVMKTERIADTELGLLYRDRVFQKVLGPGVHRRLPNMSARTQVHKLDLRAMPVRDAALEALSSFMYHDMIFSGPMAGATRIFPAVAMADAFLATWVFSETGGLPKDSNHPLYKLFPEFVDQLKTIS